VRSLVLLSVAAALASCVVIPVSYTESLKGQQQLQAMLAGKTAAAPVSCLPSYNQRDMQVIDGRTVAFRTGMRTVYVVQLSPGCELLASGHYAMLTKEFGGMGLCRGDIARVFDTTSRTTAGSCGVDQIVPYTASGSRY
jgi:hypothetical protein